MPITAPPQRGYGDWQRLNDHDAGPIVNIARGATLNTESVGPLDVSRFAYIAGFDNIDAQTVSLNLTWTSALSGGVTVGSRGFCLDGHIGHRAQYSLRNLGPYVSATWTAVAGTDFVHNVAWIATNRIPVVEFQPISTVLIDQENVALGAGTNADVWPADYFAGPIRVQYNAPGAGWLLNLTCFDNVGNGKTIEGIAGTGANVTIDSLAPAGAWKFNVNNTTGAPGNYYLRVTGSQTGAT